MNSEQTENRLLATLDLGFTQLQNRLVMGSMHTGLEDSPGGYKKLAAFYLERAYGGVALIVTGGVSPDFRGRLSPFASQLSSRWQLYKHRYVVETVHQTETKICLQLLHAGRYAFHPFAVAPSAIRAPIARFTPAAMSSKQIEKTIRAFVNSAALAKQAGYDGVEVMGSEGYLINQFACLHTNKRTDQWGGSIQNRIRFSVEIVRRIREMAGSEWIIIYRLSMLDLLEQGNTFEEVILHAKAIEAAGATILNTGIGWHEVRIPTIASVVPPAAFAWVSKRVRQHVSLPVMTCCRINSVAVAERCLQQEQADLISMARPFLADASLVNKTAQGKAASINTCIACNQSCLDNVFRGKRASCLVNPRACFETQYPVIKVNRQKTVVVVGLGMAGLSCAAMAARRGHKVIAYEAAEAGGQFNLAARIPGKTEYRRTIEYYLQQLQGSDAKINLHTPASFETLRDRFFDACVIATGVKPSVPDIPGIDHFCVMNYEEAIKRQFSPGSRIAIIGAGGIGFDVAEKCIEDLYPHMDWYQQWGIDTQYRFRGGVFPSGQADSRAEPDRLQKSASSLSTISNKGKVYLLQRKAGKLGQGLGKTTGWIHRLNLKQTGVEMLSGVRYLGIDDAGLHIEQQGKISILAVDYIILCTGQQEQAGLYTALAAIGQPVYRIGGARKAGELDAARAIREGMELAMQL